MGVSVLLMRRSEASPVSSESRAGCHNRRETFLRFSRARGGSPMAARRPEWSSWRLRRTATSFAVRAIGAGMSPIGFPFGAIGVPRGPLWFSRLRIGLAIPPIGSPDGRPRSTVCLARPTAARDEPQRSSRGRGRCHRSGHRRRRSGRRCRRLDPRRPRRRRRRARLGGPRGQERGLWTPRGGLWAPKVWRSPAIAWAAARAVG